MKLIHTADIYLDQSCAAMELPPALGNEHRAHLHALVQKILNRARDWNADAIFFTGNLFDHERVTRNTLNALRDAFAALAPVPIFLCAGQQDPAVPGSPYLTEPWSGNVHLFTTPEWRPVEVREVPLTVHGFGLRERGALSELPAGLEMAADHRLHVAIGHGLEQIVLRGGPDGAVSFGAPLALPDRLAYLGLGGLSVAAGVTNVDGTSIWYPGPLERCEPGPAGSCGYLEVEIDFDPGAGRALGIEVRPVPLSTGRFHAISLDCSGCSSGQELLDSIRAELLPHRHCPLIRVTLEGTLLRQIYDELDGIRDILGEEVHYLQWRENCEVGDDYETIALERTSLGAFVQRISAEIGDAPGHAIRRQRLRSRDLGVCAYRATSLPIKGMTGDYR